MPTIQRFSSFNICMYFDDHGTPHFHIVSAESSTSVAIDTLEVLSGHIHPKQLKEACAWAAEHKPMLHTLWKEYSS